MRLLKRVYDRLGFHKAPPGTFLFAVHLLVHSLYRQTRRVPVDRGASGSDPVDPDVLVAFKVSGGIGDHLIAARYVRDLLAAVGDFKFDVYSPRPEVARWVFSEFPQFGDSYDDCFSWELRHREYPLALWIMSFVVAMTASARWHRVRRSHRRLIDVCAAIERFKPQVDVCIAHHPRFDGLLGQIATFKNLDRYTLAHAMSGIEYGGSRLSLRRDDRALARFELQGRHYVTIHNGFDSMEANHVGPGSRATKCYPRFDELVALVRREFPNAAIVQLGTKTSQPIDGVHLNLIGRTSLSETAAIIAQSQLHIDNEGGLVHLARCLDVQSCVVFGPTSVDYFAYEENINIRPTFCGGCWWITGDWLKRCPRDYEAPRCLTEQSPATILRAIAPRLAEIFPPTQAERSLSRAA